MKIDMMQAVLNSKVKLFSKKAVDARQVSARLRELMPSRFKDVCSRYRKVARSAAQAERYALADESYVSYVDELLETSSVAFHSRVQYETHMMLVQARQSLRFFRVSGRTKGSLKTDNKVY